MKSLQPVNLNLADRLRDPDFRREWFRAELEVNVPSQFRELRERRGLSQQELAEKSGMKQTSISRFENSTSPTWSLKTLLRLSEALDAQLRIVIEASEDVISRYAREEKLNYFTKELSNSLDKRMRSAFVSCRGEIFRNLADSIESAFDNGSRKEIMERQQLPSEQIGFLVFSSHGRVRRSVN